jgi:putative addiction module component (TIGR02574 family)
MNHRVDHLLLEALSLTPEDRSLIALSLIDSLQGDGASEDVITASWVSEAKRRHHDLTAGRSTAMTDQEFRDWMTSL